MDRLGALNKGPAIIPVNGAHAFPFGVIVGNKPGSANMGLVYPKTKPTCGVRGRLGHLRDNFCVVVTMVHLVVSSNSLT